jgi:hypothetical protein
MEAEKGTPETSDTWEIRTDVEDYVGDGFIRFEGRDYLNDRTHGVLVYRFVVSTPGRYRLFLRSYHDPDQRGKRDDEENDCWTNVVLNSTTEYYKTFRNASLAGTDWSYRTQWVIPPHETFVDAYYDIPVGEHELRIAARGAYFMIDRIVLIKDSIFIDEYSPESPRTGTTYAHWLEENFDTEIRNNPELEESVWGPQADPDGDEMPNAAEFYARGNPKIADAEAFYVVENSGLSTTMRIRKGRGIEGVTLKLESSPDLSGWQESSEAPIQTDIDGDIWVQWETSLTEPSTFNRLVFDVVEN